MIDYKKKLRTKINNFPVKIIKTLTKGTEYFYQGVIKIDNVFIISIWDINGVACFKSDIDDCFHDIENISMEVNK